MSGEALDAQNSDPKEAFNIGPPYPTLQPLPSPLANSADLITRFQLSCHELCRNILGLLGTALKVGHGDEGYFKERHDQTKGPSGTIFRMLYYPKTTSSTPSGSASIRAGAHSDYGSLTLLFRLPGQAGLELQTPNGWISVPVTPPGSNDSRPPILVNIGDLLCYWTNGMLKSTVHRVTFEGGEERYSMAYFCHPLDDVKLEAVDSEIIKEYGDKGKEELRSQRERLGIGEGEERVITAKEHLERRLKVTYGL
jgi:isopenicillin N synthase-like dioxygenase